MLNGILTFQFGGFYGGDIGNLLSYWEQAGVFSYVLPFLLIFAMIFGIMTQTKIFGENKTITGIIALVIGLLALQFEFVPMFFSEIFPRLGVGLAILLVAMILLGMFAPGRTWVTYSFLGIAAIIFIVVLVKTTGWLGWQSSYFWQRWGGTAIGLGVILVIIGVIAGSVRPPSTGKQILNSPFMKSLMGK